MKEVVTMSNSDDFAFAIKDKDEFYYCGLKCWDRQIRKAKLYHSWKYAVDVRDNIAFMEREPIIVKVRITEISDCNYDEY